MAGSQVVLLNLNTLSSARTTTVVRSTSAPTASSTWPWATTRMLLFADADESDRQDPAHEPRRHHSGGQSLLLHPTGVNRTIWAMGLRNPFPSAFQRGTGRLFINDVGENKMGGNQRRLSGRQLRLAHCEGPSDDPTLQGSPLRLRARSVVSARSPAVHSTNPTRFRHSTGASTFSPISARAGSGD